MIEKSEVRIDFHDPIWLGCQQAEHVDPRLPDAEEVPDFYPGDQVV